MNVLLQQMFVIRTPPVQIQLGLIHANVIMDLMAMEQVVLVCNSYLVIVLLPLAEKFLNYC